MAIDCKKPDGPIEPLDVIVVGGGLVGACVLYFCALRGLHTLLLEAQEIGRGASGATAGNLHGQLLAPMAAQLKAGISTERLALLAGLHRVGIEAWRNLPKSIKTESSVVLNGGLMVAESGEESELLAEKVRIEQLAGLQSELLSGDGARAICPVLSSRIVAADWCAAEGFANALRATSAFVRESVRLGAWVFPNTPVTQILLERSTATVVCGGRSYTGRHVVVAAGYESKSIAGIDLEPLPIGREALQMHVLGATEYEPSAVVQHIGDRLTVKRTEFGTWLVGGGWPSREASHGDLAVDWQSVVGNCSLASRVVPMLSGMPLLKVWPAYSSYVGKRVVVAGWLDADRRCAIVVPGETGFTLAPMLGLAVASAIGGDYTLGMAAEDSLAALETGPFVPTT